MRWSGIPKVARSRLSQCSKSYDLLPSPHCSVQYVELRGTALCRVGGPMSQLDLPSLTPLSVADCGCLQLGAPHWATSVNYCMQLIIEPTFCGSRFSTGRLLAIEDFTFMGVGQAAWVTMGVGQAAWVTRGVGQASWVTRGVEQGAGYRGDHSLSTL